MNIELVAALEASAQSWGDLIKWLARAKASGVYDLTGLHSFKDAARAHINNANKLKGK